MGKYYSVALLLILTSCAQFNAGSKNLEPQATVLDAEGNPVPMTGSDDSEVVVSDLKEVGEFHLNSPKPTPVKVEEFENVPPEMQPMVDKWVNYFQGRGREHMERYLARSTRYIPLMKKILTEQGMPEDLVYISLIESGFNYKAASWASAVGYWQFIRGTGKRYGLEINSLVDERRDPVLATQAAAAYLKDLYAQFDSWFLAMASYNVGEGRVARETARIKGNFWDLVKKKRLPKETMNYVPKFIAARQIAVDPEKYGFTDVDYMDPIEFDHIAVDKPVNLRLLAEKMGIEFDDFKQLNPKFRGEIAPLKNNKALVLRVPVGQQTVAMENVNQCFVDKVEYVADLGETKWYKVRPGDNLSFIAKKFRTSVAVLREMNNINRKKMIRAGKKIMVPDRSGTRVVYAPKSKKSTAVVAPVAQINTTPNEVIDDSKIEEVTQSGIYYFVQPGDTLSVIADRYNTSIKNIRDMNDFSSHTVLKAGVKIKVPKSLRDKDSDEQEDAKVAAVAATAMGNNEASTSATPVVQAQESTRDVASVSHTVKPGENLTLIAKKYGVSVNKIKKVNNLNRRSVLKVGVKLVIPSSSTSLFNMLNMRKKLQSKKMNAKKIHVVKPGENLHLIAKKYGVELEDIKEKNKIKNHSTLFVGAKLLIPTANASSRF